MQQYVGKRPRQQNNNKTLSYLVLLIVVIVFIATVGVRLLINTSIFINNLVNKGTTTDTRQTDQLLATPEIIDAPDATHSAQITITIQNVKDTNVKVLVNDVIQKEVLADENTIEAEIDLEKGDNSLVVDTQNPKTNEIKHSPIYHVTYIEDKPQLEITTPVDGSITDKQEITVGGKVGPDISVRVNGQPIVVGADGTFTTTVKLVNGENKIAIEAQNDAGTTETQTVTIRYEP